MRIRGNWIQRVARFAVAGLLLALPFIQGILYKHLLPSFVLILIGAALRVWCNGVIMKSKEVCQYGPYAIIRHPMYMGTFFIALGYLLLLNIEWWIVAASMASVVFVCIWRAIWEEKRFSRRGMHDDYQEYRKRVPMLVPLPWIIMRAAKEKRLGGHFSWQKLVENGEVTRMSLGLVALMGIWASMEIGMGRQSGPSKLSIEYIGPAVLLIVATSFLGYVLIRTRKLKEPVSSSVHSE